MSDDAALLIPIQFALEEARAALAQLEAQARAAGKATGEGFGSESKKGLGGFLQTLQAFKSEQVQQGRQARFFAGEILSILPASDAARGGMEQLLGMFIEGAAGGIGFGLALEGVKLAVSAVSSEVVRGSEWLRAYSAAQDLVNQTWAQGRRDIAALTEAQTEGQKALIAEGEKLLPGLQAIDDEINKLKESGPGAFAWIKSAFGDNSGLVHHNNQLDLLNDKYRKAAQGVKLFAVAAGDLAGGYEQSAAQEKAYWDLRAADEKAARERALAALQARKEAMKKAYEDAWQLEVDYATRSFNLEKQAQEVGLTDRQKVELEYQRNMAGLREGDTAAQMAAVTIRNAKLEALDKQHYEADYGHFYENLNRKARAYEQQVAAMAAIQKQYDDFLRSSILDFSSAVLGAFKPILTQSAAYNRAMKESGQATKGSADLSAAAFAAMTQEFLANLSLQAASKSIFEIAEGYAALSNPLTAALAPLHFTAAANYGIVAGVAAAGAVAIGATRGTTRAERDSISSQTATSQGTGVSSGGTRGYGGGSSSGGGTVTIRETVYVIGDAFESPAETARRAARVMQLADRLDMTKRAA